MPVNCPLAFSTCDNCRLLSLDDKCCYYFPPQPLSEILTYLERSDRIEAKSRIQSDNIPQRVLGRQMDTINQLKGQLIHLQKKLNEHIDLSRKGKKKQTSEGVDL